MNPPSPRAAYTEFKERICGLCGAELHTALDEALTQATGIDYSGYMVLPKALLCEDFVWHWYRYVLWRYHVYGELLHELTWQETLLMLSEEPTVAHATDAIRRSIRNHWKGIFPSADKKDTYIALHTTRADRSKSAEGGVIDTVRRRKPTAVSTSTESTLELPLNQSPQQ